MSSSDSDNESDIERFNDVSHSINLYKFEERVEEVLNLYTVDSYRWISNISAYSIVQCITSPSPFRQDFKLYMTKQEWSDFKLAMRRKVNATPFMMTFVDILCDFYSACDESITSEKLLVFLSDACRCNTRLRPIVTAPMRKPVAPKIVDCLSVSVSKNWGNRPNYKVRTISSGADVEGNPVYSPILFPT